MLIDRHRLIVCVGTGGVGKTTVAASLAIAAAARGRRAVVLTIDPARALARALGLDGLAPEGQEIRTSRGAFTAAMLDTKRSWDAFVRRHAPSAAIARALDANPFYQRLSTSFAGATEYMAIEEVCRFAEDGRHDLIVLDTPPAAHALDFVRAPEKIDRLLASRLGGALAIPRFLARRLERATGARTLHDIATFFEAAGALAEVALVRARRARALLHQGGAAFVLIAAPRQLVLDETLALADRMRALDAPLAAVVVNRVHAAPPDSAALDGEPDTPAVRWLRDALANARVDAAADADVIARFRRALGPGTELVTIAEAAHDLHAVRDLETLAETFAGHA
ncbi:MAG TPA: ArsA-related P-loop ATPase [Kofleriaceae bacterium]|nr:ArsA-related P-loop ATPase [Kofleriaceae bacterium]